MTIVNETVRDIQVCIIIMKGRDKLSFNVSSMGKYSFMNLRMKDSCVKGKILV